MPRSPTPPSAPSSRPQTTTFHPRTRSRSRSRSRSPNRTSKPRPNDRGFRWKERPRRDDADSADRGDRDRGLARGYRHDAAPRRDYNRDRDDRRDRDERRDHNHNRDRARNDGRDRNPDGASVASKFGNTSTTTTSNPTTKTTPANAPRPAPPQEPMIIVNVNDRLGTKAAIPCLASDPVRLFKAQVAARIGRQPHEIMIKRQGERPFKDVLTLADYGVSSGVQLDLELDTGD